MSLTVERSNSALDRSHHDPGERSDEELVAAVRHGDDSALTGLLTRYRRFARARASNYFVMGGDREDVVQEGMIGLYKAIRDYEPDREASFRSFAELCITRQILTAIKTATRQKHVPLNTYVSFDKPTSQDSSRTIGDTLPSNEDDDPLRNVLNGDEMQRLRHLCAELLSDLETEVLDLYVEGRSYQEIAESLGRHVKSVDNALQRIKRKLEAHLLPSGQTTG